MNKNTVITIVKGFSFKQIFFGIIIIALLSIGFYIKYQFNQYEQERVDLLNELAEKVPVEYLIDSTLVRSLASINESLKVTSKQLSKQINRRNETIRSQTEIIMRYEFEIDSLQTLADTLTNDAGKTIIVRRFKLNDSDILLNGYFLTTSPFTLTLEQMLIMLRLNVIVTEDQNKRWAAYGEAKSDRLKFQDINITVNPYKPTFWDNINFSGGFGIGDKLALFGGAGYGKHSIKLFIDSDANKIWLYERRFGE